MTSVHQHLQDCLADLTDALTILHRLLPRASTLRRLEDKGDKGCASCRRVKSHDGTRQFHSDTEREPSGAFRPLCQWCRKYADAERNEWRTAHPNQPEPSDSHRWWPPKVAVEWYRDRSTERVTPTLRDDWRAAKRAETKKGKRKAS